MDENRLFDDRSETRAAYTRRRHRCLFVSAIRDGNVRGRWPRRFPLSSRRFPGSIYLSACSFLNIGTMNDKMFRALKRDKYTRTTARARKKMGSGWRKKRCVVLRSVLLSSALLLFLPLSLSHVLHFYHPLGRTSIERPTQKNGKSKKTGRSRATKTGTVGIYTRRRGERVEVTRRTFPENKPPRAGHRLNYRSNIPPSLCIAFRYPPIVRHGA